MGFGRKIDDGAGLVPGQQVAYKRAVTDVSLDKNMPWIVLQGR